jgi:hypothetical protein
MFVALSVFVALAASPARADGFFDNLGKAAGLVAPPADPPDFVKDSRPSGESKPIAVFAPPNEPSSKVKTPAEIKAMDADLEGAARDQNAPRRPRAAKAPRARSRPGKLKVKPN